MATYNSSTSLSSEDKDRLKAAGQAFASQFFNSQPLNSAGYPTKPSSTSGTSGTSGTSPSSGKSGTSASSKPSVPSTSSGSSTSSGNATSSTQPAIPKPSTSTTQPSVPRPSVPTPAINSSSTQKPTSTIGSSQQKQQQPTTAIGNASTNQAKVIQAVNRTQSDPNVWERVPDDYDPSKKQTQDWERVPDVPGNIENTEAIQNLKRQYEAAKAAGASSAELDRIHAQAELLRNQAGYESTNKTGETFRSLSGQPSTGPVINAADLLKPINTTGQQLNFDLKKDYDAEIRKIQQQIQAGDYSNAGLMAKDIFERNAKVQWLNETGQNIYSATADMYGYDNGVNTPLQVWRANRGQNGAISDYTETSGATYYNPDGSSYMVGSNGNGLSSGDAVQDPITGEFGYWSEQLGRLVDYDTYNRVEGVNPLSMMSQDELIAQLYDMLYDNFAQPTQMDDFMTWAEAQALAGERFNGVYGDSVNQAMDTLDKQALNSGFYGQIPLEVIKAQTAAGIEADKTAKIMDFARSILNDDRDTALRKLDAMLDSKQIDSKNIIQLIELAQRFGQDEGFLENGVPNGVVVGGTSGFQGTAPQTQLPNGQTAPGSVNNVVNNTTVNQPAAQPAAQTAAQTGTKTPSAIASKGPTWDNGSKTASEIKALQKKLGVTVDGYYGDNTAKAAGGLGADDAYAKFVTGNADAPAAKATGPDLNRKSAATSQYLPLDQKGIASSGATWDNGNLYPSEVGQLQAMLGLKADGYYGSGTQSAVAKKLGRSLSPDDAYRVIVQGLPAYQDQVDAVNTNAMLNESPFATGTRGLSTLYGPTQQQIQSAAGPTYNGADFGFDNDLYYQDLTNRILGNPASSYNPKTDELLDMILSSDTRR